MWKCQGFVKQIFGFKESERLIFKGLKCFEIVIFID